MTIDNDRFHAESPGMMIENGTPVEVVDVRGTRLVVRSHTIDAGRHENSALADPLADTVAGTDSPAADSDRLNPQSGILDFEIPEG